ncbi:MAG: hypothetical protein PW734_09090 [Verrucomicrobium sp.]|nr:hypothetical protein [Verrucomicrobium sp.]
MSQSALLKDGVLFLGGLPRPTESQILDAAAGRPVAVDLPVLGEGPIRGTRRDFVYFLGKTVRDAVAAPARNETSLAAGAALIQTLESLQGPEGKEILAEVAHSFRHAPEYAARLDEMAVRAHAAPEQA